MPKPSRWPTLATADQFYGDPRNEHNSSLPNPTWERVNITTLSTLPFEIRFDGRPVRGIRCHRLVAEALNVWLRAVWKNAGYDQSVINAWGMGDFGGSYVYRPMRGSTRLSVHAYGAAFDFDPARNSMHDRTPHFATLRREVVQPFLDLGGTWGGDWDGDGSSADERRCDGMHFEFIDPDSYRRPF